MITTSPTEFLETFATLAPLPDAAATARAAYLVAPAEFTLAEESARDNRYMDMRLAVDPLKALAQHGALAQALRADLPVITFPGDPATPDAVFPNNVFATAPGRLIIGRMRHPVRQREAERRDIRDFFGDVLGYDEIDLSGCNDLVAELTGSLIIDRARGVGYCGLGERCDLAGAQAMHKAFDLRLTFCFELAESEYHTNVVLTLMASRAAIIAADGFRDPAVPQVLAGDDRPTRRPGVGRPVVGGARGARAHHGGAHGEHEGGQGGKQRSTLHSALQVSRAGGDVESCDT